MAIRLHQTVKVATYSFVIFALTVIGPRDLWAQCSAGTQIGTSCNGITYEGCCMPDMTLLWCENGVLCSINCAANPNVAYQQCGWSLDGGFYDCGANPVAEPTCTHPYDCPGYCKSCGSITYEGCCDGQVLKWCECGCLRTIDCSKNSAPMDTCGWSANEGFYNCGGSGEDPSGLNPRSCSGGACVPNCGGKQCGDDGCGGSCGQCPAGYTCNAVGLCEVGTCTPNCTGKECGSDGCGGSCGTCPGGYTCDATGHCVKQCVPNCVGKECGDDGCGGSCGQCPSGKTCVSGTCIGSNTGCGANPSLTCQGKCGGQGTGGCWCDDYCVQAGDCCPDFNACCSGGGSSYPSACNGLSTPSAPTCPPGLTYEGCCDNLGRVVWCEGGALYCIDCAGNGLTCGWAADGGFYDCDQVGPDPSGQHPMSCDGSCTPNCVGKQCGSDGCGGVCGVCPSGTTCNPSGQCVGCTPNCTGKECGDDGCGGSCGVCPSGQTCNAFGQCVENCIPQCAGKECGDDGCGGVCGFCSHGYSCIEGTCKPNEVCVPDCTGKECGPDGCGGSCGVCQPPLRCSEHGTCYDPSKCTPNCTGKECGDDGCGGSCGQCEEGYQCIYGHCEARPLPDEELGDYGPSIEDVASGSGVTCPEGQVLYYGKCQQGPTQSAGSEQKPSSGCTVLAPSQVKGIPVALLLIIVALGVLKSAGRRGPYDSRGVREVR